MGRKTADTCSSQTSAGIQSTRQKMDMYKVAIEKQERDRIEELQKLEELQRNPAPRGIETLAALSLVLTLGLLTERQAPTIVAEELLQQNDDSTPTPRTYEDDELLEVIRGQTNLWLRRRRIRLNTDNFDVIDNLGAGSYGRVFRVTLHDRNIERAILDRGPEGESVSSNDGPPKEFALKVLPKNYYRYKNGAVQVMAEREALLKGTHSPMIVTLYAAFQDRNNLYMLSELVPAGSLRQLMQGHKDAFTSVDLARFCTAEILLGVDAVHQLGFTHRDVKPDNVVITEKGHLKLLDFGLCAEMDPPESGKLKERCGTPLYMSPEMIRGSYTHLCDLWAVGIIFFEMLYKDVPFRKSPDGRRTAAFDWISSPHSSSVTCHDKIYAFPLYLSIPPKRATTNLNLSEDCREVLEGLLTWEKGRFTFEKLKRTAFFQPIRWERQHLADSPLLPLLRPAQPLMDAPADASPPRVTPRTTRFNCNGSPLPRAKTHAIHDTDRVIDGLGQYCCLHALDQDLRFPRFTLTPDRMPDPRKLAKVVAAGKLPDLKRSLSRTTTSMGSRSLRDTHDGESSQIEERRTTVIILPSPAETPKHGDASAQRRGFPWCFRCGRVAGG